ncbi:hypothetical protein B0H10DRAFT_2309914 [Mycena sp. CBHHK59/15]|nr:hypothetical protein B0H10DRAFT_2309914 [Mycena sp. CBHHK59/15]
MPFSSSPRLPPEIVDFIIQELDDDQAAFLSAIKILAPVELTLGLPFASLSRPIAELLAQIGRLVAKLPPHLQWLTINYQEEPIPPAALKLMFTSFREITTLQIFTYFPTLSDAVEFACAFPLLRTLDFKPLYSSGGDILSMSACQYLCSASACTRSDLPQLQKLLQLFGSSLEYLLLKFTVNGQCRYFTGRSSLVVEEAVSVNLTYNDSDLQTLEFHMLQTTWMAPDLLPILATVGSKRLEKIVWGSGRRMYPEGFFFGNLDAMISRTENFPRLKKLVVTDRLVYREKDNPWFSHRSDRSVLNDIIQYQDDEPPFWWLF